ncbi:hypothetical protein [Megamonas hypermegale]|uniref:hypothetical protein n=1 Tax=Megamonas hypermegale TaxID=158847 RepID=UPI001959EBD6|nr:hypothetical protein [Megamonas hypermegale]MBM6761986.1 hypothetical protein [Megamonas hypermegale]
MKKKNKTQLYNDEVVKIYKNPLLTVDEAVEKYFEFKSVQKFLKRPTDKTVHFVMEKLLNDFLRINKKPPSLIEYRAFFRYKVDCEFDRLKEKGTIEITENVSYWYSRYVRKLDDRFAVLNPEMVEINSLYVALMNMADSMKGGRIYESIKRELTKLEYRADFKCFDLLVRLPFFQDMFYERTKILIAVLPKYEKHNSHFEFKLIPTGTLEQRKRAVKFLQKAGIEVDKNMR